MVSKTATTDDVTHAMLVHLLRLSNPIGLN